NGYLSPEERVLAPTLYQVLQFVSEGLHQGQGFAELESAAMSKLREAGFEPDYVSIRRAIDLAEPQAGESALIVLAAVYLGTTRLIDNLLINMV
ncbi:MAG: pantoate--beta-alanine ligase, partial [Gammaproteobacteria bacterium]|nr:pantoate--beta-alanine ligase [Gammaproteobacteria bacterium]